MTNTTHAISLVLTPEPWRLDAACAQVSPDDFFPEVGQSSRAAMALCAECRVRECCLEYALRNNETEGIYGGKSPRQRARMRRDAA